jgi:putative transposase
MLRGMNAYAFDLRDKIRRACGQRFGSQRASATLFGVSQSFVEKLVRRRRTSGSLAPKPHAGGRRASGDEAASLRVRRMVQDHPDATLAELCEQLYAHRGRRVRVPTLARLAKPLGLPRQKSRSLPVRRTLHASSRRVRITTRCSRHSTSSASSASMQQASIWP